MNTTQRLTSLETRMDGIEGKLDRLIGLVEPKAPARVTRPAKPARRKPQPKADREVRSAEFAFTGERVGTGPKALTRQNRKAFIAAHAWAKPGFSTSAIRSEVAMGAKVNKGWNVAI